MSVAKISLIRLIKGTDKRDHGSPISFLEYKEFFFCFFFEVFTFISKEEGTLQAGVKSCY